MPRTTFYGDDSDGDAPRSRRLRRLMAQLGIQGRALERICERMADLEDEVREAVEGAATPKRPAAHLRDDERDRIAARQGIGTFHIEWLDGKRAHVHIDGKTLELSPRLAELLALLASSEFGDCDDVFVGWKTLGEIARKMSPKSPEDKGIHTTSQNLWRLRRALLESGINRHYLQSDRARGARLLVRRGRAVGV